jgi:1,4-dihydroxy-2-naphthoate octaprenyltransferase
VTWPAALGAVGTGALACAVLVANNLRDVPTDAASGKYTLAVRLGTERTRWFYAALVGLAFLVVLAIAPVTPWALLALAAAAPAVPPVRAVLGGAEGLGLLPVLRDTGRLDLIYSALLAAGLALSSF